MIRSTFKFLIKRPAIGLALSFFITILAGTFLLKLPWATKNSLSFLDALFTSTSATCVTGLIVKDTGADFTLFGQIVIIALIQFGIMEIMGVAALFFLVLRKKITIARDTFLKKSLEVDFREEARKIIKFIFISIFSIEALGAIFLFLSWNQHFPSLSQAIFSSIFHSVSAFCNAGFSLFSENLESFRGNFSVNIIFGSLIFLGGIGFLTLREFQQKFLSLFRKKKVKISLYSKIIIVTALILIVLGAALFSFFEKENLSSLSSGELCLTSLFQSVAKTSGFNTVNIGELSNPTALALMFLMFIGAAPGSASGGIKVISLALIVIFIIAFFKKRGEVVVFRRFISPIFFKRVLILISVCLLIVLVGALILLYTEGGQFKEILFEAVSAFGTVGWSMGATSDLSAAGKVVVVVLMYLGRIIPLGLALIGSKELIHSKIHFSEEKIYLG